VLGNDGFPQEGKVSCFCFSKRRRSPPARQRDRLRLRQFSGPAALKLFVFTHDSRYWLRQLEAIMS
jgi:hypothetical protein